MLNSTYLLLFIRLKKLYLLSNRRLAMATQLIRINHRARQKQALDIKKLMIAYIEHNRRLTNNQLTVEIPWTLNPRLVYPLMLALFKGTMTISCSKLTAQRISLWIRDHQNNSAISRVSSPSARCHRLTCLWIMVLSELSCQEAVLIMQRPLSKTLTYSKEDLINSSLVSDLRPCRNFCRLKSDWESSKLRQLMLSVADAIPCLVWSKAN